MHDFFSLSQYFAIIKKEEIADPRIDLDDYKTTE